MTFTIGQEVIVGTVISVFGTAIVGAVGWVLRVQIAALIRALSAISLLAYLWLVTVAAISVWVVAQFTDRQMDLSFKIMVIGMVVGLLLASIPTKPKQDDS